jgi:hypothetical protein
MKVLNLKFVLISIFFVTIFSLFSNQYSLYAQNNGDLQGSPGGAYPIESRFWGTSYGWTACMKNTNGTPGCFRAQTQQYFVFWTSTGSQTINNQVTESCSDCK